MKSNRNLFEPVGIKPVLKEEKTEIIRNNWRDKYPKPEKTVRARLENTPDDSELNRMIQLKNIDNVKNVEGKPGSLYYDKSNKKVKIFISEADGWKDITYS